MPRILLQTAINAPAELCCRLSLSVEAHQAGMMHTGERVVAGRTSGQFESGDSVTWEARHFGIMQQLQVRITALSFPDHFCDEMTRGIFKKMQHDHYFSEMQGITSMKDDFYFEAPLGLLGKLAEVLFLTRYMKRLLQMRNNHIRMVAESQMAGQHNP